MLRPGGSLEISAGVNHRSLIKIRRSPGGACATKSMLYSTLYFSRIPPPLPWECSVIKIAWESLGFPALAGACPYSDSKPVVDTTANFL